ncbi:hypothetical protein A5707_03195 [Mycobacterium kyorinense]|uniref:ESX-1 secretion-associated protein EspA/EspE-like domain-containing protein n=1 Tax=Mycobacterium kyorinense TaxID=487514 RepID=A0A1A2Z5V8_9MYCO|nr:hypothetical protein [Mycobacterium kyorinense]OBI44551.1 hypothetical protein A5707_03195 [Mycobacterium kyorinense]
MPDYPPGRYSHVLVGHVWPSGSNLATVGKASTDFGNTATAYQALQDQLRQARFGPLAGQAGVTADDVRDAFQRGESHAGTVAEKNAAKLAAFTSVRDALSELRSALTSIAEDGETQIAQVQRGDGSAATKLDNIGEVVLACQARANAKAAACGEGILSAVQRVLDAEGIGKSARQFAAEHGIDTGRMFAHPNLASARAQAAAIVYEDKAFDATR